jgi:hypothetical protein
VSIHSQQCEHKTFTQPPQVDKLVHCLERNFPGASFIRFMKRATVVFGFMIS